MTLSDITKMERPRVLQCVVPSEFERWVPYCQDGVRPAVPLQVNVTILKSFWYIHVVIQRKQHDQLILVLIK